MFVTGHPSAHMRSKAQSERPEAVHGLVCMLNWTVFAEPTDSERDCATVYESGASCAHAQLTQKCRRCFENVRYRSKETLDQDVDPLANVNYTDMKPLVNSYIQKLVQTKWDVAVHGRDLYLVKPTLGPPKKFQHLTRAEEVVITQLRIGHTKVTKSHILSRGPPTGCHHCGQTLTIDHMLLECALLQECRDEYYTVNSLNALFETIPETCIVEFLREAGFFYLIWYNIYI